MDDGYVGEIRFVSYGFIPYGWLPCDGTLVSTQQYQILFAVIGNRYGGSAQNYTFALPDLRGRAVLGYGAGPGLTPHQIASFGGTTAEVLSQMTTPAHTHTIGFNPAGASANKPDASHTFSVVKAGKAPINLFGGAPSGQMDPNSVVGVYPNNNAILPHSNVQPYTSIQAVICTNGEYPVPADS